MSRNVVPVSGFSVQNPKNVVPVSRCGVARLETLCLSTDLEFRSWKRCRCQRIWCSESENVVPVSGFGVQSLETLRFLANMVWGGRKRCACQGIWR